MPYYAAELSSVAQPCTCIMLHVQRRTLGFKACISTYMVSVHS